MQNSERKHGNARLTLAQALGRVPAWDEVAVRSLKQASRMRFGLDCAAWRNYRQKNEAEASKRSSGTKFGNPGMDRQSASDSCKGLRTSEDTQEQALEVFALGKCKRHRMVCAGGELTDDLRLSPGIGQSAKDNLLEQIPIYGARA